MDHHCMFVDNCIGKANMPYFFQFIGWALIALTTGLLGFVFNVYWRNTESGYGAQGILDGIWMAPQFVLIRYIFFNREDGL